jgi:hypothetical protein
VDAVKVFRLLIVAEIVLTIASSSVAFMPGDTLPPEVDRWFSESGMSPLLRWIGERGEAAAIAAFALAAAFVGAYFAALIGLLLLKAWARTLYIGVFIAGVILYPLMGAALTTPVAAAVDYLLAACTGAILALLFVGPVQERFAHA